MSGLGNIQFSGTFASSPAVFAGARNGASVDLLNFVVLGQDIGEAGDPAILLNDRFIPLGLTFGVPDSSAILFGYPGIELQRGFIIGGLHHAFPTGQANHISIGVDTIADPASTAIIEMWDFASPADFHQFGWTTNIFTASITGIPYATIDSVNLTLQLGTNVLALSPNFAGGVQTGTLGFVRAFPGESASRQLAQEESGSAYEIQGAITITLPAVAAGLQYEFWMGASGDTFQLTVDGGAGENIIMGAMSGTNAVTTIRGSYCRLICNSSDWRVLSFGGTWALS